MSRYSPAGSPIVLRLIVIWLPAFSPEKLSCCSRRRHFQRSEWYVQRSERGAHGIYRGSALI